MIQRSKIFLFSALIFFSTTSINNKLNKFPLEKHLIDIRLANVTCNMPLVDCIYVINLTKKNNNWIRIRDTFRTNGLFVNRVNAVNGWELHPKSLKGIISPYKKTKKRGLKYFLQYIKTLKHAYKNHFKLTWELNRKAIKHISCYRRPMKAGAVGCFLSQVSVFKNAYENDFNTIWLLEDDAEIVNDIQKIPEILNELHTIDPLWDILYTDVKNYGHIDNNEGIISINHTDFVNKDLMQAGNRYGTHSMLISRNGIKKLLEYFISYPLMAPIDIEIHWIPNIRKYSTRVNIVSNLEGAASTTEFPP